MLLKTTLLEGSVRLKKGKTRLLHHGAPWVYSNELHRIETKFKPGSWVTLESPEGKALGYGFFNPHSLIAFRLFELRPFESIEETKRVFMSRMKTAYEYRVRSYYPLIHTKEMGAFSFRLCFGESDGLPGLVVDLFEGPDGARACVQCHAAGADLFLPWVQEWLEREHQIRTGVVRNDLDVRRRENVELYVTEWGDLRGDSFVLEGGVRFLVDLRAGQKTGYFYDHRDNRRAFALRMESDARERPMILDCFSYVGGWGLQVLKQNPRARLIAVDVSDPALQQVRRNAEENRLQDRVEVVKLDFFKDRKALDGMKFDGIVADPPALTSSAKQAAQGKRAHETCFTHAASFLREEGVIAFASCSFHLTWDDFLECSANALQSAGRSMKFSLFGSQALDHPVLSSLPETRYLKCVMAE